jgi:glycogen operon protein
VSWYDWDAVDDDLLAWTQRVIALRRDHPVFRRRRFFQGRPLRPRGADTAWHHGDHLPDIAWFRPDGAEMTDADWTVDYARSVGVFLNGAALPDPDVHGRRVIDASFYLVFNGWDQRIDFILPDTRWTAWWTWYSTALTTPITRRPACLPSTPPAA